MSVKIVNLVLSEGAREWPQWAVCAVPGTPSMFPHEADEDGIRAAKTACLGCPVRSQCLEEALGRGEKYGIWGGLTPEERSGLGRRVLRGSLAGQS